MLMPGASFAVDIGREGGAGGGIKINGKVISLAEAGLVIENPEIPYFPDDVTVNAAEDLMTKVSAILPPVSQNLFTVAVFANDHLYQKVKVVNQDLFNKVKTEYQQYLGTLPVQGEFTMAAYTSDKTTYLFPDFFEAEPSSQAIYLLHETAFYLKPDAALQNVLRLEIAAVQFIKDIKNPDRMLDVYIAMWRLGLFGDDYQYIDALYFKVLAAKGVIPLLSDFVGGAGKVGKAPMMETFAPALMEMKKKWGSDLYFSQFYRSAITFPLEGNNQWGWQLLHDEASNFKLEYSEARAYPEILVVPIDNTKAENWAGPYSETISFVHRYPNNQ